MENCYRQCPNCSGTFAHFYVKEEPAKDRPFYLVVFICQTEGCHNEWEEPIYEERILRKIKSQGYRQGFIDNDVNIKAQADQRAQEIHDNHQQIEKWKWRGLTEQEIRWKLRLRVKKVGGRL